MFLKDKMYIIPCLQELRQQKIKQIEPEQEGSIINLNNIRSSNNGLKKNIGINNVLNLCIILLTINDF